MKKIFVCAATCLFLFSCSKPGNPNDTGPGNGGSGTGGSGTGGGSGGSSNCSGPAKTFAGDVNPVIQSFCATGSGCHGSGSNNGPGPLLTYLQVFNARSDIRSAVASGHMPPGGGLSETQKNSILCWIDNGAPNN